MSARNVVLIAGKTCTGKSTLAGRLVKHGYTNIELDDVVVDNLLPTADVERRNLFIEVYRERRRLDFIEAFVHHAQEAIERAGTHVVVEGAVAQMETARELFAAVGEPLVVYLHPVDIDRYMARMLQRFALATAVDHAWLPSRFWAFINDDDFGRYCDDRVVTNRLREQIRQYALSSQEESELRYASYAETFRNVMLVNV